MNAVHVAEPGQLPPQAPELEQAILGALMFAPDKCIHDIADVLPVDAFYVHAHKLIYRAIIGMYERGIEIDILTVTHELKKKGELDMVGGPYYISTLTNRVCSSAHVQRHSFIVIEQYIAREAIRVNSEAMRSAYNGEDVLDLVPETIAKMEASIAGSIKRRSVSYSDAEKSQLEQMDSPRDPDHSTGYRDLDRIVGGYMRGNLTIIGARPGMGKTAFAFSSASLAADNGTPTGFFSLEMNERQAQARLFSRKSGIPLGSILGHHMTDEQIQKRHEGLQSSEGWPLWIRYDSAITLSDIRAEATRMVKQHGVGCIFIDQLNWITPPKSSNRNTEVGEITRGLKQLALQLNIAVVLLHQLSRSVETRGGDKRPQMSDLRDSGNVEQDAQLILFPYRPEYYGITEDDHGSTIGALDIFVAKNTNGALGTARLFFDAPTVSVKGSEHQLNDQYAGTSPLPSWTEAINTKDNAPF